MQTVLVEKKANGGDFYGAVTSDIKSSLIQFVSERGWGKSTALKNIVKRCMEKDPNIQFYAFDTSQSWYKKAPLKYRQLVTREKIKTGQVANIPDCVYEIGSLSEAERRVFLGIIIKQHYERRYQLSLSDPEAFNRLPWCVYILEEANVYFGSFSLRMKDWVTPVLQDFVSVGRNYKMSAFLVATAEQGEISPSLRRRSRRIYGKLVAEGDIAIVRRTDKAMAEYLAKDIPRFNFIYWGESFIGPIRVLDTVTETPADYIMKTPPIQAKTISSGWIVQLLLGMFFMVMLIYFFLS
jgi:hypothetical protein